MNIRHLGRIGGMIFLAVLLFASIQLLGGYLIAELTSEDNNDEVTVEVVEKTILRLETKDYYTYQLGIFAQSNEAQEKINACAQMGYRVWVTAQSPYQLMVGCWADKPTDMQIADEMKNLGQDAVVIKKTLNEVSLKYKDTDYIYQERIAPLIAAIDVALKQSIDMFAAPSYDQYTEDAWQKMIDVLKAELNDLDSELEAILLSSEVQNIKNIESLSALQAKMGNYAGSLDYIINNKNDLALYLAESYLLEFIATYHDTINLLSE